MLGLLAELGRDQISESTEAGQERARAEGRQIGRPNGFTGKSILDGRESQIEELLRLKVTKVSIAKICNVRWPTLNSFIKSRGLVGA